MSNEVNQAYLRAYIKNRVANRNNQDVSAPLPSKNTLSPNGEAETTFRRADLGRPVAPVPRQVAESAKPIAGPAPVSAKQPAELNRVSQEDVRGVWSPLGVERGMKGAGAYRAQPAVVVNGTPTTINHPVQTARPAAEPIPAVAPNKPIPRSVTSPAHPFPSIRIDSGHSKVVSHLAAPPSAPVLPSVPVQPSAPFPTAPFSSAPVAKAPVAPEQAPAPSLEPRGAAPVTQRQAVPTMSNIDRKATTKATNEVPLPVAFRPSWEVDQFFWPEVLMQLEKSSTSAFEQIGHHLRMANQDGLRVMAISSGERGVGRSTVAMHLARCAAAAGLQVGLMDADTYYPSLIDQLRLDLDHGWQDCLFENVPLEEVAVRSIDDNITVYPLTSVIPAQQLHANLSRIARIVKRISSVHDIVFLDSNRLNLEQRDLVGVSQECVVDAAVIVIDSELSIKEKVDTANSILHGMGIASVGMVENFHA